MSSRTARYPFRYIALVISILAVCALQLSAENKALKSDLEHALMGKTFLSTIVVGGRATPRGYSADYPVNTVVTPEGQVTFRVEWGLMRADVGTSEMVRRFERGTSFRVASIELKDDRLELKLENSTNDSAKLKLMLNAGWQSQMDSAAVVQKLSTFLVEPEKYQEQLQHRQVAEAPRRAPSSSLTPTGTAARSDSGAQQVEKSVAVPPEDATPDGRARWAKEQSAKFTYRLGNVSSVCIFNATGDSKDRLVIECDDIGWSSVLNRFVTSSAKPRDTRELYDRGFTTFHVNPYTCTSVACGGATGYVVDIRGTTVEKVVTDHGLKDPSLQAILAMNPNNSANGRRDFAAVYSAFVKDANCEVKTGGAQAEVLLLSCRNSAQRQMAQVYSDTLLPKPLFDRGFKTMIFSDGPDVFMPAVIAETGFAKAGGISSKQLLEQYGIKSAEQLAEEELDRRNYKDFVESFVDKMLEFSNAKHAKKYASARWTQSDWAEYNRAVKSEAAYLSELRSNKYVRRSSFWPDARDFATAYVGGGGVWQGAPTGLYGRSVTTGSPEKDAQRRAELLAEIELARTQVI